MEKNVPAFGPEVPVRKHHCILIRSVGHWHNLLPGLGELAKMTTNIVTFKADSVYENSSLPHSHSL